LGAVGAGLDVTAPLTVIPSTRIVVRFLPSCEIRAPCGRRSAKDAHGAPRTTHTFAERQRRCHTVACANRIRCAPGGRCAAGPEEKRVQGKPLLRIFLRFAAPGGGGSRTGRVLHSGRAKRDRGSAAADDRGDGRCVRHEAGKVRDREGMAPGGTAWLML